MLVSHAGIRAVTFYGGFFMNNTTDIEFGNISCDKSVAVEIKHDDSMKDDTPAYIQVFIHTVYCIAKICDQLILRDNALFKYSQFGHFLQEVNLYRKCTY